MKIAIALLLLCGFAVFSIKVKNQLNTKTSPLTEVKLNEPMPDFTLPDASGQPVKLSEVCQDNQVVMINFWASWCAPCRMEMPEFEEVYRSNKANGFTILAINVDKDRAKADAYLQSKPVSFPTLFDKNAELLDRFKVESLPTTILVGHDGKVLHVYEGVDPYIQYTVQNDLLQKKHGP